MAPNKAVGVAFDFSDSSYDALRWAYKHLSNTSNYEVHVIHIIQSHQINTDPHQLCRPVQFKDVEEIRHYVRGNDIRQQWLDFKVKAFRLISATFRERIIVHIYESTDIPKGLQKAAENCQVELLVVGGGQAQNAGSSNYIPGVDIVRHFLERFQDFKFSIVIAK